MNSPIQTQLSPLHTHTVYSVLDGASTIEQYLNWCVENGAAALGVTDHGWMIGALELYDKAKKKGITPLPGCEFYVAPDGDYKYAGKPFDYFHVTVWAVNEVGYRNLLKLGSMAWKQDTLKGLRKVKNEDRYEFADVARVVKRFGVEKPRITYRELLDNNEGLVIGSGCLIGAMNKAFLNGEFTEAERNLMKLLEVYKGRIFMEIMPHICFEGNTQVSMADGSQKRIQDVSPGDYVLSYDEKDRKVVPSRVVRVHKNPSHEGEFVAYNTYGAGLPPQKAPIVCTKDHRFWDGSGWVEIGKADFLSVRAKAIGEYEKEVLSGILLGDASILKSDALHYCQAEQRKDLVELVRDCFGGSISQRLFSDKQTQYRVAAYHPLFRGLRSKWYPKGKKKVPHDLRLTPVSLAWWFMDDGTLSVRREKYFSARLCTQGFEKEDVDFLIEKLKKDLNIDASIVKSRGQFAIAFGKEATKQLSEIVAPHLAMCCRYKLHPAAGNIPFSLPRMSFHADVFPSVKKLSVNLPDRIRSKATDYSVKYDLEVEGTHCYFAEGVLAHNCDHDYNRKEKKFEMNECTDFSPDGDLQKACNLKSIELARKYDVPLLMTVDSHFVRPEQKPLQDVMLQNGDPDGWRFYNSYHMMTTEQAWDHWSGRYGDDVEQQKLFCEAVENNLALADMAKDIEIKDEYHQPVPEIPAEIRSLGLNEREERKAAILKWIDFHGRMRWDDPVYCKRLATEIEVICDNGIIDFSDYFLFLEKVYRWTRENSILANPGRGSGAGSLLCYLLKITHLNPFTFKLPFERFLSHARLKRGKFPDIDCDFGDRDPLIAHLEEIYGDKFAQCSTHATLKIKSSLKDACRVILGWNSNDVRIDSITKGIALTPQGVSDRDFLLGYKDQEGNEHKGHLEENEQLQQFFIDNPAVKETMLQLLGIPRAVGRHASAYFISDRPIHESAPTCNIGGMTCTQYTANAYNNYVEKAGLIKFDFLRINTLSDISRCIRLVQRNMGYKIWEEKRIINGQEFSIPVGELDITELPFVPKADDPGKHSVLNIYELPEIEEVFKDFDDAKTESVFQMQTSLMTGFAKRIKPRSVFNCSDIVALVRPGPLEACIEDGVTTMTEAYIKRKDGELPITYAHPGMEPILKDTYGVAVYQEQLQQMFIDLAGYSSEEADYLREVLAKKKKQEMEKALPELRRRLVERGWTETQQEVFVGLCIASSAYSFNRAHAASYAMVAYQCAFLKHFFKLEWWTAVLGNAKVSDIREKNFTAAVKDILKTPHVNGPTQTFELDNVNVHAPLYLIDGVGDAACKSIMDSRASGPYLSLQDFFERVDKRAVNQGVFHQLIVCGAFADLEPGRTAKGMIEEYQYLKKVSSLKAGEGKSGADLREAVAAYRVKEAAKGKKLDIEELYKDDLELEVLRMRSLSIYRLDAHSHFRKFLEALIMYDNYGHATFRTQGNHVVEVLKNRMDFEDFYKKNGSRKDAVAGFVGLIQEFSDLRYTDKKTGKPTKALKIQTVNDGDELEVILWPDLYEAAGKPNESRLLFAVGNVKPSRDPGKWSMSAQYVKSL